MTSSPLEIVISRHFHAPREAVFAEWLEPEALKDWFTPQTYMSISAEADARVGGQWQVEYQSPEGHRFREHGVYQEIEPFDRLVLTLTQSIGPEAPETTIVVKLEVAAGGGTLMHFHQTGFNNVAHRDGNAEGWQGCFDKLAAYLARTLGKDMTDAESQTQIETLFIDWLAASSRKDIEAAMEPISETIVSYEHSMPLEVRDISALREECLVGFERAGDNFQWSIPDLKIIVRGDIAVTWGLNRMADYEGGQLKNEMWSRGTRIFQRFDGEWKMIHQHVSFPFDPSTGKARIDLKPASNS